VTYGSQEVSARSRRTWVAGWVGVALLTVSTCAPDIANDRPPDVVQFDPTAEPPRSPEPNAVVINPDTGLIDFGVLGRWLPPLASDCQNYDHVLPVAQCEFYMYLQTLDGFPSVSPVRVPVSAPLDLSTVAPVTDSSPGTLFVLDREFAELLSNLRTGYREKTGYLTIESPSGWRLGHNYVMALRGYDDGVRAEDGNRVVASATYFMLRQAESLLDCTPDAQDLVPVAQQTLDPLCKWFELTLMQLHDATAAAESLITLETLRQSFVRADFWNILNQLADWRPEEVAIVWSFPIHTNSVAELNPSTGIVPQRVDDRSLRLPVKGAIDPASLIPFDMLGPPLPGDKGTVILLNLTALAAGNTFGGFPEFTVDLTTDGSIAIRTTDPMTDGEQYGIVLTVPSAEDDAARNGVTSPDGRPLVPSPVTVLLRSRGPIVDAAGESLVSGITDEDGADLEAGRLQLVDLLDDPTFTAAAKITRENVAYLYAFEFPNP
jgi:hypothetical protein